MGNCILGMTVFQCLCSEVWHILNNAVFNMVLSFGCDRAVANEPQPLRIMNRKRARRSRIRMKERKEKDTLMASHKSKLAI